MIIAIDVFETGVVPGVCSECAYETECRVLPEGLVCECCIEEPLG